MHHSEDEIPFFLTYAFLSSVCLGRYWWLNIGNLNMLKERKPPSLSDVGFLCLVSH